MWADSCASAFNFLAKKQEIKVPLMPTINVNSDSKLSELNDHNLVLNLMSHSCKFSPKNHMTD